MSRICTVCDKGSKRAAHRSHAKNKVLRRQNPNLQLSNGALMCTRCIRSAAKKTA